MFGTIEFDMRPSANAATRGTARFSAWNQAVVNDQMRVLNWTHLPPLAACT